MKTRLNGDLCRRVAWAIRRHSDRFDMRDWGDPVGASPVRIRGDGCGTPGCIAGYTVAVGLDNGYEIPVSWLSSHLIGEPVMYVAREFLGLALPQSEEDYYRAFDLFAPDPERTGFDCSARPGEPGHITAEHAAKCLEHLADTGLVEWWATQPGESDGES